QRFRGAIADALKLTQHTTPPWACQNDYGISSSQTSPITNHQSEINNHQFRRTSPHPYDAPRLPTPRATNIRFTTFFTPCPTSSFIHNPGRFVQRCGWKVIIIFPGNFPARMCSTKSQVDRIGKSYPVSTLSRTL